MENIINSVKNLIGTYGFGAATVIVLTIVIVNLAKKPILKQAEKFAKEKNCDKAVLTRYIAYLPFAVSLVLTFFWRLTASGFDFFGLDWGGLASSSVMYAAVAIATYESVKVNLRAYAAKKNAEGAKTENDQSEKPTEPEPTGTKSETMASAGHESKKLGSEVSPNEANAESANTSGIAPITAEILALAKRAAETIAKASLSAQEDCVVSRAAGSIDPSAQASSTAFETPVPERKQELRNADESGEVVMSGFSDSRAAGSCDTAPRSVGSTVSRDVAENVTPTDCEPHHGYAAGSTETVMSGFAENGNYTPPDAVPQVRFCEEPAANGDYPAPRNY